MAIKCTFPQVIQYCMTIWHNSWVTLDSPLKKLWKNLWWLWCSIMKEKLNNRSLFTYIDSVELIYHCQFQSYFCKRYLGTNRTKISHMISRDKLVFCQGHSYRASLMCHMCHCARVSPWHMVCIWQKQTKIIQPCAMCHHI